MAALLIDFESRRVVGPLPTPGRPGPGERLHPGMAKRWARQRCAMEAAQAETEAAQWRAKAADESGNKLLQLRAWARYDAMATANYTAKLNLMLTPAVTKAGLNWKLKHRHVLWLDSYAWKPILAADAKRLGVTVSEVEPAKFKERKRWTDRHELIRDRIEDLARQLGVPTPG